MNKIELKNIPALFEYISEFIIEDSYSDHRRNSNFFTKSIIEFTSEHSKFFPEVPNFNDYLGTWETNVYISDREHGTDWSSLNELTRVEKKTKIITTTYWEEVK